MGKKMSTEREACLLLSPQMNVYDLYVRSGADMTYDDYLFRLGLKYASENVNDDPSDWIVGIEMKKPSYADMLDQESAWWDSLNSGVAHLSKVLGDQVGESSVLRACINSF